MHTYSKQHFPLLCGFGRNFTNQLFFLKEVLCNDVKVNIEVFF